MLCIFCTAAETGALVLARKLTGATATASIVRTDDQLAAFAELEAATRRLTLNQTVDAGIKMRTRDRDAKLPYGQGLQRR